jgi:hypothetical protein
MSVRSALLWVVASACADLDSPPAGIVEQQLSTHTQQALDWANGWISEVIAQPGQLAENVYTTSSPVLQRMIASVQAARNRSVCGTFITMLFENSVGWTSSDFFHSFNKNMDSCQVGTVNGTQEGTSSPDAAQYQYKIASCPSTGTITFTPRATITAVQVGDIIAVGYPERTDITGHVLMVRSVPVASANLPAGPAGSTGYTVEVIDSTSTPHGAGDWRGGTTGQGLGTSTFVLYADASGTVVASRWSPSDPTSYDTTTHPLGIGGVN